MPASFNQQMVESTAQKVAGESVETKTVAMVKYNAILGKEKPRLIHHFGPEGSVYKQHHRGSLCGSAIFMERSLKKGSED